MDWIGRRFILIFFGIVLFTLGYFQNIWSSDFVDPCCSGLCGRCPPSFWECQFMNTSGMFLCMIAVCLVILSVNDLIFRKEDSLYE